MLVVVGLIAFLTAAIVAVIPRVANASKVAATKATIKKVDEMLNDRINGFRRWIQKQDQMAGTGSPPYVCDAVRLTPAWFWEAGSKPLDGSQSLAASKDSRRKAPSPRLYFPQSYGEVSTTVHFGKRTCPRHSGHPKASECGMSVSDPDVKEAVFDTEPPSAADLKAIETADTDHDGIPEGRRRLGTPAASFYRWPTRSGKRPARLSD